MFTVKETGAAELELSKIKVSFDTYLTLVFAGSGMYPMYCDLSTPRASHRVTQGFWSLGRLWK